jgi:hypothetical protein
LSRAPVCSPTAIICTTIGGNTSVSASGSLMVLPSSTDLRVAMMASSTMALPAVRAVMASPSRIGTPEAVRVARVRQNRATAILRMRMPKTGAFSSSPSRTRFPL